MSFYERSPTLCSSVHNIVWHTFALNLQYNGYMTEFSVYFTHSTSSIVAQPQQLVSHYHQYALPIRKSFTSHTFWLWLFQFYAFKVLPFCFLLLFFFRFCWRTLWYCVPIGIIIANFFSRPFLRTHRKDKYLRMSAIENHFCV